MVVVLRGAAEDIPAQSARPAALPLEAPLDWVALMSLSQGPEPFWLQCLPQLSTH